jgi:hypothetical protein
MGMSIGAEVSTDPRCLRARQEELGFVRVDATRRAINPADFSGPGWNSLRFRRPDAAAM